VEEVIHVFSCDLKKKSEICTLAYTNQSTFLLFLVLMFYSLAISKGLYRIGGGGVGVGSKWEQVGKDIKICITSLPLSTRKWM
jgi:hypothetical protein